MISPSPDSVVRLKCFCPKYFQEIPGDQSAAKHQALAVFAISPQSKQAVQLLVRKHTLTFLNLNWSEGVKLIAGAAGAFFAAWAGAQVGFRRAKRERALDRRITWHEQTIQALAKYEEKLERLHGYFRFVLLIKPANAKERESGKIPETIKVPQVLWAELQAAEESARGGLRLADVFTDLRTQVECSTALAHTVNVVSSQWTDISPEPEISWADLSIKALRVGTVRARVQDSMKRVLEMDGFLASIAPWYARWRHIRRIEKMQREIVRSAS